MPRYEGQELQYRLAQLEHDLWIGNISIEEIKDIVYELKNNHIILSREEIEKLSIVSVHESEHPDTKIFRLDLGFKLEQILPHPQMNESSAKDLLQERFFNDMKARFNPDEL